MSALSLHVASQKLHDSTLEVSWCVSKEVVSELQQTPKDQRLRAWCFLIARAKNGRETRKLAPLCDGRAYINLPAPGAVRIFAVLLVGREVDVYCISVDRLKRGGWKSRWVTKDGAALTHDRECRPFVGDYRDRDRGDDWAVIDVVVPDGVFGQRPSDREMTWLCAMISSVPEDGCAVRRRRLFAYSVQPLLVALFYAAMWTFIVLRLLTVVTLVALVGIRGLNWSKWNAPDGFFNDRISSVFFDSSGPRRLLYTSMCPLWWLLLYLATPSWSLFIAAGAGLVTLFGAGAVAMIVLGYCRGRQPVRRDLSLRTTRLDRIVCSELNPPVRRRSIRLYCAELKAKVCRPVAGSAGAFPRDD